MGFKSVISSFLVFFYISVSAQISQQDIKNTLDGYSKQTDNTALLIYKSENDVVFKYATGLADKENKTTAKTDDLFEIGSASKMFTAISILQLIEKGKLSLETPISEFYKKGNILKLGIKDGKNHFNEVTVGMLLNHTSGFIDYLNVYEDDEKAMEILAVKGKIYSFDELINLAVQHGDSNFTPGEKFKYCNTGYIILGDIISKVSKEDWKDYIQKNIFDKADMKNTFFGSRISKANEKRKMRGYFNHKPTFMPPTLAGSAGEVVSNLDDLAKFLKAWQGGKLLSQKTTELQRTEGFHQMYDSFDALTYGYGIMNLNNFYGHGGQTFGFQTYVTYNPKSNKLYVVASNDASVGAMILFITLEGISLK